ncbi:sigma-70 family RNA polymerase sigma factor [Mariniphaga sediminis]|jgi:RNA polymerase sigma factor (sigma-70 family)|uniref:Sigma-70 family RNA polymerase sigma factor n=1 Tax=Mariniphaga sediminis TaxID=1628158 RepID=A0A399D1G8_9BACT|nr:sigma-70 family RNA polymerase sigma factor [Mariniphaga sediminis]RIH65028.1 sigma-70 family RNA polymerase sigma factor [Mariniphaga sediminis]
MKSDKQIWNDFIKGENYALSHIYFRHIQMLFRYGKKFSQDDELIKDTIQDLFFDLIRTRKNLGETDNIRFYLMASFRRKLAKTINQKVPLEYTDDKEITAEIVYSFEHELINKEELNQREQAVKKALAALSPKQREILYYKYTCSFDYEQICEIMKLRYDSARKQVSRALKALKEVLDDSKLFLFFLGIFSVNK